SLPLGWYAHRYAWSRGIVLTTVGLLYTVPSLALFMLLPPVLGISMLSQTNVLVALSLYAAAIMVRNAADAFASIDPAALRAATALGYAEWGRFFAVELPLAGPVLVAGLRVVAVSTVSLVTVGVLVGVPSLGYFFTDGFQRRIVPEVATGVIMTFLVAMALDAVLVLVGRILLPWSHLAIASTVSPRS
ncbi:MAG: ABC transporter permease subunit, partial [Microbacteriaceae bacterium]|nr:ABC transporter permease subunit [Microbacteriaceae bacterium]